METKLREIVQIIDNNRHFIMFVFTSGVRELYDITGHENIRELKEVKTLGKLAGRDYNGNNPNPPPLTTQNVCQMCGTDREQFEKQRHDLLERENELIKREKELDNELKFIKKI